MMTPSGGVRAGLNLTLQYAPTESAPAVLAGHLRMAEAVRDAGWDSVFVAQHYLGEKMAHLHPLPLLGLLSSAAGDMRLGAGICLLALQNPVDVAEAYATADIMCGGRLVFGAGLGYRDVEYEAFGVSAGRRVERFVRNLELVSRLWQGETIDVDLPWCRLDGGRLSTLPVQRPRPPIWLAANSDQAVRRAAELGDAWLVNPHAAMSTVTRQMELFRTTRAGAGLPPPVDVPLMREVVCAPDRATATARARRHLAGKYAVYRHWGQDNVLPPGDRFDTDLSELSRDRFLIGNPSDCLLGLREWIERIGATEVILRVHWAGAPIEEALQSIELLSTEVLPYL
ncbi:monooxygenase [Sphaerisporangium melleum]|uniref:Monooxygenase n=1 Tax=Sphaerisporangium melleum TaxID=321316 RepID=A0A917RFR9_9ACTN|nr:LLM class flavin-dependent oxidoreductase [Sphaerisporangium melleum]GGL05163.1 monooxygenase [Sphaerisporangium melleum]GII73926.1 monooxygenase [Sphaerisporangium melleum]